MFKRSRSITMILMLTLSLFFSAIPLKAQSSTTDWSRLNSLESGNKIVVKLKNGKSYEGKLNSVSDSTLSLTVKSSSQELKREEVITVHRVTKRSATKGTLIGAGVGAGAGAITGVAVGDNSDSFDKFDQAATAALTILGAGVGAITGFLIGRSGGKRELIYEAR
jgi:small nuclear ribonucleoprotein (snRNP)-like protein